jgi:hypothetical protein
MGAPFVMMDAIAANRECGRREQQISAKCGGCGRRVILHCSECKISVTGCICSHVQRFGTEEAFERLARMMGEEAAARAMKAAGFEPPIDPDSPLWTPGKN